MPAFPRRIAFLLAWVLLVPMASASPFPDANGTRYDEPSTVLAERGMLHGYPDGNVRPYNRINRVEALKVLLLTQDRFIQRVQWYESHMPSLSYFPDAPNYEWYGKYVEAGVESGLVKGHPDGNFRPGNNLTIEQAVVMLFRAYGVEEQGSGADSWFNKNVEIAIEKHIIAAEEDLYLGEAITRGQLFDMVYRMDEVIRGGLPVFADGGATRPMLVRRPVPIVQQQQGGGSTFTISIPNLGITDLLVTHPTDSLTSKGLLAPLQRGVGHLFSYPGNGGKIMVYGHSSSVSYDVSKYTKIFRRINELRPGDRVYVSFNGTTHVYEVSHHQVIAPNDSSVFNEPGEELVLYTCWPPDTVKTRYLVRAVPVEQVAMQ